MGKVLLSLWLAGAALYTINTIIIADAVNLFGGNEDKTLAAAQRPISDRTARPAANAAPPQLAPRNPSSTASSPPPETGQQAAPEIASSGRPGANDTNAGKETEQAIADLEITATEGSEPVSTQGSEPVPTETDEVEPEGERVAVTAAVNMRAGPTTSAPTLTVQQAGTELQVLGEEGGWVEVLNPDTNQSGWIYSRYLEPVTADRTTAASDADSGSQREETAPSEEAAEADTDQHKRSLPDSERNGRSASDRADAAKPSERKRAAGTRRGRDMPDSSRADRRRYAAAEREPEREVFEDRPYPRWRDGPYGRYGPYERYERYGPAPEPRRRGDIFEYFFGGFPDQGP